MEMRKLLMACAVVAAAVNPVFGQAGDSVQVDSAIPAYKATTAVSGNIKSIGSDTMNNLMTLWGEEFKKMYPNVKIEIEGKGSSTAPAALIESQAQFGPMSRAMKASEVDKFEAKFGYKPTELRTSIDALAVYVHKDNPIKSLSMDQVRKVFSVEGQNMTWGDLGLTGEWASKPVSLYGRNSASGTYGFFKEVALGNKDYKPTVKEQPGSSSVVQGVAADKFGMGYSGLGYMTADVRAVPLSVGGEAFEANAENSYSGDYPLARFLYTYINHKPGSTMEPLRAEFIKLIFSRQGQEVVLKDGYLPVPADIAREELKKLSLPANF
jgi:phosphate transport system substrate-binding protein